MYQRPTAPLSIGGVLDDGFRLTKASFTSFIGLSVVAAILGNLPYFFFGEIDPENPGPLMGPLGLIALVTVPIAIIFFGAIIARIAAVADGETVSIGDSLGIGLRRLVPVVLWAILYAIAIILGSLLLLVPGIILGLSLSFGAYIVIIDRAGPFEALKHSHRLVWGNWWRTAVLLTVVIFVFAAAYILLGIVSGFGVLVDEQMAVSDTTSNVVSTLLGAVINPVSYCFSIAILNDLRLRKQGEDLERRIETLESA